VYPIVSDIWKQEAKQPLSTKVLPMQRFWILARRFVLLFTPWGGVEIYSRPLGGDVIWEICWGKSDLRLATRAHSLPKHPSDSGFSRRRNHAMDANWHDGPILSWGFSHVPMILWMCL
jgi:hypothetical protein